MTYPVQIRIDQCNFAALCTSIIKKSALGMEKSEKLAGRLRTRVFPTNDGGVCLPLRCNTVGGSTRYSFSLATTPPSIIDVQPRPDVVVLTWIFAPSVLWRATGALVVDDDVEVGLTKTLVLEPQSAWVSG